jgi:type I restriction enzyme R subunit
MPYTEVGVVEKPILDWLNSLKWTYVAPKDMAKKRQEDFEEPLVVEELKESIRKINKDFEFTDADLDFILVSLRGISPNIEGIRKFLDVYRNGLVVPLEKERKEKIVRIIDLQDKNNNSFIATNQFKVEGTKGSIRADIVLLVNGIPLVLIECKSPAAEQVDWLDAYKQIKRYEDQAPEVFKYVQLSIATDSFKTFYFPNAFLEFDNDALSVWKDTYPEEPDRPDDSLKTTVYGMLTKENLLDLIDNFVFIRKEKSKVTKIAARYMQYRASNKIFSRVLTTLSAKKKEKFGLVWHWQGSGKTYTMAFTAWKLLNEPGAKRPSIFVVVDRKDLEEQIEKDFSFIEVPLEKITSIRNLIEVLKWGGEGKRGIFLVTIEKFSPKEFEDLKKKGDKLEIDRENIIVLADEVHRTQYGDFSIMMRSVFKSASIFGFTGTPLSKAERNTFQKFCPTGELYLDRYSMLDAMKDGFTVPLSYQARLPDYHLKPEELKQLKAFEDEELKDLSPEERKRLSKNVKIVKEFLKKDERVKAVVEDIASHFKEIVEPTGLKAMIVTCDREACLKYKRAIDKLLPESASEIVMTPDPNREEMRTYFENLRKRYGEKPEKEIHREIIDKFITKDDPKILIVTDMLITGFDAPCLWTMYLDKPLKEHRILQAIARTNRPYKSKKFGLIVDYIGALTELEEAFSRFEASDATHLRVVIRKLDTEKTEFKKLLTQCLEMFEGVKKEDTKESLDKTLSILVDLQKSRKFENLMKDLMKSYEMLSGDPFLRDYLQDYKWLVKVYIAYNKKFKKADMDELKIEALSKKTISLIKKTIDIKEIDDSFPIVAIDKEYIEALKKSKPTSIGAAIDILTNIQHEGKTHQQSPFFRSLTKEVQKTCDELRAKKIEIKEAIQKAFDFSAKIGEWKKQKEKVGEDKYPIYEAVKSVIPDADDSKAIAFSTDLLSHLKGEKLLFDGWHKQRDVRRRIKAEMRILLLSKFKEYKSKIDELEDAMFAALESMGAA